MNTIQEEPTTTQEPEAPPVSYDEAKLERLVFESPPGLDEPIKKKTRQMSREYMRDYYHTNKTEVVCCFWFKTYTCKCSLVKHQGRSYAQYNVSTTHSQTSLERVFVLEITWRKKRCRMVLKSCND